MKKLLLILLTIPASFMKSFGVRYFSNLISKEMLKESSKNVDERMINIFNQFIDNIEFGIERTMTYRNFLDEKSIIPVARLSGQLYTLQLGGFFTVTEKEIDHPMYLELSNEEQAYWEYLTLTNAKYQKRMAEIEEEFYSKIKAEENAERDEKLKKLNPSKK